LCRNDGKKEKKIKKEGKKHIMKERKEEKIGYKDDLQKLL
jgi:hypothetical protein